MGGRVAALAFAPGNAKTYFVGFASGGLWKTENLGTTFRPVFDDQETCTVGAVAVADAPADWGGWTDEERAKPEEERIKLGKGKIVWVGTGEGNGRNSSSWGNGVYRSADGGATFKHVGLPETHDIPAIAVNPKNPDVLYVAALGHLWGTNPERGIFKTTDGGETWEQVLKIDDRTGGCDVHVDPQNPEIVYAALCHRLRTAWSFVSGGDEGGIYKSTDGGKTWRRLTKGLPKVTGRIGLAVYPKNPNILIALVQSHEGGTTNIRDDRSKAGGLFRSEDGGETWVRVSQRTPRAFYFARVYFDPTNDQRIWMLGWVIELSEDGGKTFRGGIGERNHVDHHALIINPDDPNHLVNGNDGGVYQSFDGGKTWCYLDTMAVGQFYNVQVDDSDPYRVIGGLQDNGTWMGPSATDKEEGKHKDGTINAGSGNRDWDFVLWGDGFHACFDPTDRTVAYGEWQGGNLTRVHFDPPQKVLVAPQQAEGGPRFRFNWNSPFFISPHNPTTLYLGGNYVFRLTDRGAKWERISPDLTTANPEKMETVGSSAETHCTLVSLAESPLREGLLWAGSDDGRIHVTVDGGRSWKNVTPAEVRGLYVAKLEVSRHAEGTVYAAIDGHRSDWMDPMVLATDDLGATWREITGNLPKNRSAKSIREDHANPDVLYVGTEGGFFATFDRGGSWVKLHGSGLPTVPVDDFVIHPRERDLVLGTHGRSIWILDDAAFLGQLTEEFVNREFALFDVRPAKPRWYRHFGGIWTDQVFRAPNPPMGARITYWLRDYPGKDVSFTIENEAGLEVAKLSGPNAPGVNRVIWDLQPHEHMRLPDQGQESDQPFFVPPGVYRVKGTCGKHKVEGTFEVLPLR